jgi:L-glutamine---4-(methylsulfanyl)-2-oxobutanoate aminotransferase
MHLRQVALANSAIRELTIRARQVGAVNLSQGFPDEDTWPEIREFALRAIQANTAQYTDPRGEPGLRDAIARKCYGELGVDPESEVVVTCGATEGMIVSLEALIPADSDILLFSPFYENYRHQAYLAQLTPRYLTLHGSDLSFTSQDLENAYTPRLSAVILCNPSNPTGKVFSVEEIRLIVDFAEEHDLIILADETYQHFLWNGSSHHCLWSVPEARRRSVVVASFGKTYSVTGWRVGYIIAPPSFVERIGAVHDFHTITAPHPFQVAIRYALEELGPEFLTRLRSEFGHKKAILGDALRKGGFDFYEPNGSYFYWCDYSRLSNVNDTDFAEWLLTQVKVAGLPGSVFLPKDSGIHRVRFTFSKSIGTLQRAAERLTAGLPSIG